MQDLQKQADRKLEHQKVTLMDEKKQAIEDLGAQHKELLDKLEKDHELMLQKMNNQFDQQMAQKESEHA